MDALHAERPPREAAPLTATAGNVVVHPSSLRQAEQLQLEVEGSRVTGEPSSPTPDIAAYKRQLAEGGRDHGLKAAARADGEWLDKVVDHLEHLAPGSETSADEIRHHFGSSMAMGSAFRVARKRGWIIPIGHRTSTAPTRRRGEQRVWERT